MKNISLPADMELLTPSELARRLRVSPVTLRKWADKGLIQSQVTLGGHRRYPVGEVERLLQSRKQPGNLQLRILIVDDDPFISAVLQEFLCSQGDSVAVDVAGDGFAAGQKLVTFKPGIILLDLMMPGLDGFEVCRKIKGDPATAQIRVIAMTGYPSQENIQRILSAGAEVCLLKPVDTSQLLTAISLPANIHSPTG